MCSKCSNTLTLQSNGRCESRAGRRGIVRLRTDGARRDGPDVVAPGPLGIAVERGAPEAGPREDAEAVVGRRARRAVEPRGEEPGRLGGTRVIQRRFNVSVPRARVPEKASTLRDRSER